MHTVLISPFYLSTLIILGVIFIYSSSIKQYGKVQESEYLSKLLFFMPYFVLLLIRVKCMCRTALNVWGIFKFFHSTNALVWRIQSKQLTNHSSACGFLSSVNNRWHSFSSGVNYACQSYCSKDTCVSCKPPG